MTGTLGLMLLVAAPSLGKSAESPAIRAPVVQAVLACRPIADSARRLACYDAAAAAVEAAEARGDLLTMDSAQRRTVLTQAFGLNLPSLSLFDHAGLPDAANSLRLKIERATRGADGRWVISLEGDQGWRQIDDMDLARDPRPGVPVVIRRAALGSFMMSIDGQPPIRVHRDR